AAAAIPAAEYEQVERAAAAGRLVLLEAARAASADAHQPEDAPRVTPDAQPCPVEEPPEDAQPAPQAFRGHAAARCAEPDASATEHRVSSGVRARFAASASAARHDLVPALTPRVRLATAA